MARSGNIRIGTSGYVYNHWRGVLYPDGLPQRDWFSWYAGVFDTVEINNTFYQLPSEETFRNWAAEAPHGFRFALKFSRYGTHIKKLKDRRWVLEFRDARWLCDEVYAVLRAHNAALCLHDLIANHPEVVTADWVYLRFHGKEYGGSYTHQALTGAARRIERHVAEGHDVYAYFNNDAAGWAVKNAQALKRYLNLS